MNCSPYHILIVNQHGDNRGDEAALRAMIAAFRDRLGDVRFTILHQFRDHTLCPSLDAPIEWYSLVLTIPQGVVLTAAALLRFLGIGKRPSGNGVVDRLRYAYETADLVVSAPGGPYFGDLYVGHEIFHWYYIWLAKQYKRKLFLYAPSVGPFNNRLMRPIRRWLFPKFDDICVREAISAGYLEDFLPDLNVVVTADSALQRRPTGSRANNLRQDSLHWVAVSIREHDFPKSRNGRTREELAEHYLLVVESVVKYLSKKVSAKFLFIPQLCGTYHNDTLYLEEFGRRLGDEIDWELFDREADSEAQQDAFASADFCIASRYHPMIFAAANGVPGICISYEHKMTGFMHRIGMERFVFPIDELDEGRVIEAVEEIIENHSEISSRLLVETDRLREVSASTTDRAITLIGADLE